MSTIRYLPNELLFLIISQASGNYPETKFICSLVNSTWRSLIQPFKLSPDGFAFRGHQNIIQWLMSIGLQLSNRLAYSASKGGQFQLLRWLVDNGCPCLRNVVITAAEEGHLEILQWLRTRGPIDYSGVADHAGYFGRLDVVKWAVDSGGILSRGLEDVLKTGSIEMAEFLDSMTIPNFRFRTALVSCFTGNFSLLDWVLNKGVTLDETFCARAAAGGNLEMLKYLRSMGCPWNTYTCDAAAEKGHIHIIKWARQQMPQCTWTEGTCRRASNHQLETLKWLRANGCPWGVGCAYTAASVGDLETLQWIYDQQGPIDYVFEYALESENVEVIKWIYLHGFGNIDITGRVELFKKLGIIDWVIDHGVSYDPTFDSN